MAIINFKLISHPMNWITVMLMLVIAGAIGHYLLAYLDIQPATGKKQLAYTDMPSGLSPGEAATGAIPPQSAGIPTHYAGIPSQYATIM